MRSLHPNFRLCVAIAVSILLFGIFTRAQEKPKPSSADTPTSKPQVPVTKKMATPAASAANEDDLDKAPAAESDNDSPEQIRKRDEWFYKQRSSVNGHIPAGARFKAFEHMQHMMEAEGKLVRRPDGFYVAASPQGTVTPQGAVTTSWTSIGPTPTTGGVFSPVTGRVTTIAVDPSDSSGNTVLIGAAQGGIWRSIDAGATWTAVGDQSPSLAMGSIGFAPSQPTIVYAGTGEQASIGFDIYYGAGVLKSIDRGLTWTPTCTVAGPACPFIGPYLDTLHPGFGFFNFGGARISYIAVNPQNPNLVLVAAQLGIEGPTEGIYCSSDGGAHWSNIFPDEMATFVGFASSTVAFAAFGMPFGSSPGAPHGNGIYKSTNANSCSATFSPLAGGLPAQTSIGRIDLGISPNFASDNTVYASIADASPDPTTGFSRGSRTNLGVFLTTNGGTSWVQTSAPDICQRQCWYDNVVKVDPLRGGTAFFGGAAVRDMNGNPNWVVRTTNSGASWTSVIPALPALGQPANPGVPHVDNHAIALFKLPSGKVRLYLGNDGGIWRTDDAEASSITWINLNNPSLTLSQFYPSLSIHPSNAKFAYAGTQDNSSQQYAGSPTWGTASRTVNTSSGPVVISACGDGGQTAIDAQVPSTVYISCQGISVQTSYLDGAAGSFVPAINGIGADYVNFIPPLAVDPNAPNVGYFGTTKIYQTIDAGNTWTSITGGDLAAGYNGDVLTTISVAPGNSSVVYAGSSSGFIFSSPYVTPGTTFANFGQHPNIGIFPNRSVTSIAIDPSDPTGNTAFISFSGFSFVGADLLNPSININDPSGHVFKTTDGGFSLVDVSCSTADCSKPNPTDLPNIPANAVVIDPNVPNTLYVATDLGVFVGNCSTMPCTWSTLGTGLPHVAVLSLRLHEASRTLRAATHGRGAWDILLNNFTFPAGPHITSITPTSAAAGSTSSVTLTVNGSGLTGGTIQFGGTALTTTSVQTDTQLTATVATSLLVTGTIPVTVKISSTSVSNSLPFDVLGAAPTLASCASATPAAVSPCSTPVQTPNPNQNIQLNLTGTNFVNGAQVLFNGTHNGVTTSVKDSSHLTATLPAALLGPFGSTNTIAMLDPPPGGGKAAQTQVFIVAAPAPPNDNFANAINISVLSLSDVQDSSGATTETRDPVPACARQYPTTLNTGGHLNGLYNTIWYKFTPLFSATLNVDTRGSSYDTVLSIWTGSPGSFTPVACNDDINPGIVTQSELLNVPLTLGTTYYLMVSSFGPPDPNPVALGGRSVLNFVYNNGFSPAPTVSSIMPTGAKSGDAGLTLTVNGSTFLPGATVTFNGTPEATTFINSSQLTATIQAADIVLPGTYPVQAWNSNQGGPTITFANFTVSLGVYPAPNLTSIRPQNSLAGALPFTLAAIGTNFAPAAVVNFNNVAKTTLVSGSTYATITVDTADIANAGTVQISITNPPPGGGASITSFPFTIIAPNPVPTITSISPTTASNSSSNPITLTINGTNFQTGATAYFNGNGQGATVISPTQLTMLLYLGGVAPGTYPIAVTDPYPGGTATTNFTVTGPPDFSITSSGTTTQTVAAGQTATFTNAISIAAQNGFSAQVNLSCTLPIAATATTCSVTPNMFTSGSGTATVTVATMARGFAPPVWPRVRFISRPQFLPVSLLMMLLSALLLRFARTRRQRFAGALPLAILVLLLTMEAIGCGGGSSPPPPPTGTPAGTYTVTVTATSGTTLTHTTTLTVVVQ
jgi:hypothetical protein